MPQLKKRTETKVEPDQEQLPFRLDHIKCKCGEIQSAKILHGRKGDVYLHHCVNCKFLITKKDWKSIL